MTATALLVVAVSGCTSAQQPAEPTSSTPTAAVPTVVDGPEAGPDPVVVDGIGLAILQNRPDYAIRGLQLAVTNTSDSPVTVTSARFDSPQFASPVESLKQVEVPAGLVRHVPVLLPEAVCPAPAGEPELTVSVIDASGATRTVTGRPADPFAVLTRIAREDCLDEAVAAVAALRLDDELELRGTGSAAVARVRLIVDPVAPAVPAGGARLRIEKASPTILLQPVDGTDWPLDTVVEVGDRSVTLTLPAVPARCDPHAIAEDKRGTVIPVAVTIEGGPDDGGAGTVSVPPSDALRLAIYDFIAARCGFAAPSTAPQE